MRRRNLSPRFFRDEDLVELPMSTRLLFAGLWCLADREGRLEDRPRRIRLDLFPRDDVDVDADLGLLADCGKVIRYEVDGNNYLAIPGFTRQQSVHPNETASSIPAPKSTTMVYQGTTKVDRGSGKVDPRTTKVVPSKACISEPSSTRDIEVPNGTSHWQSRDGVAARVFEAWQGATGHQRARLTPGRSRLVATRMREGFTEQDLTDAVLGVTLDPWQDRKLHDGFEVILRDAGHVEKFRDLWRAPRVPAEVRPRHENPIDQRIRESFGGVAVPA